MSRIADVQRQLERGEQPDLKRVAALQALDIARADEVWLDEAMKREDEADEQFRQMAAR